MGNKNSKIQKVREDIAKKCDECEKMAIKCLKSQPKSKSEKKEVQKAS